MFASLGKYSEQGEHPVRSVRSEASRWLVNRHVVNGHAVKRHAVKRQTDTQGVVRSPLWWRRARLGSVHGARVVGVAPRLGAIEVLRQGMIGAVLAPAFQS